MSPLDIAIIATIGLAAGALGGLAGIGGSLVMLPGLVLFLGYETSQTYHTYMAAAMMVNIAVSVPAAIRHNKAGAVRFDVARSILPVMAVSIIVGVLISDQDSKSFILQFLLACFIGVYCLINLARFFRKSAEPTAEHERIKPLQLGAIGAGTGVVAGLLGIGGGIVMIPLLQIFSRLNIRHAIGTSSAIMCLTAVVGAITKLITLGQHGQSPADAFVFAIIMAPGAVVGAWTGARLTHSLPLQAVRVVISLLLLVAAARLAESALSSLLEGSADAPPANVAPDPDAP
jgi:uncharacterized membrane protein YfcA